MSLTTTCMEEDGEQERFNTVSKRSATIRQYRWVVILEQFQNSSQWIIYHFGTASEFQQVNNVLFWNSLRIPASQYAILEQSQNSSVWTTYYSGTVSGLQQVNMLFWNSLRIPVSEQDTILEQSQDFNEWTTYYAGTVSEFQQVNNMLFWKSQNSTEWTTCYNGRVRIPVSEQHSTPEQSQNSSKWTKYYTEAVSEFQWVNNIFWNSQNSSKRTTCYFGSLRIPVSEQHIILELSQNSSEWTKDRTRASRVTITMPPLLQRHGTLSATSTKVARATPSSA